MIVRPLVLALLAICALAGCGGDTTVKLAKVASNTLEYVAASHPSPGSLDEISRALATTVDQGASIKPVLDRVAAAEDRYGEALASAICIGLGQVADYRDEADIAPPTPESWETFLEAQVQVLLPNELQQTIERKVDLLGNAATLAQINPQLAVRYLQECLSR